MSDPKSFDRVVAPTPEPDPNAVVRPRSFDRIDYLANKMDIARSVAGMYASGEVGNVYGSYGTKLFKDLNIPVDFNSFAKSAYPNLEESQAKVTAYNDFQKGEKMMKITSSAPPDPFKDPEGFKTYVDEWKKTIFTANDSAFKFLSGVTREVLMTMGAVATIPSMIIDPEYRNRVEQIIRDQNEKTNTSLKVVLDDPSAAISALPSTTANVAGQMVGTLTANPSESLAYLGTGAATSTAFGASPLTGAAYGFMALSGQKTAQSESVSAYLSMVTDPENADLVNNPETAKRFDAMARQTSIVHGIFAGAVEAFGDKFMPGLADAVKLSTKSHLLSGAMSDIVKRQVNQIKKSSYAEAAGEAIQEISSNIATHAALKLTMDQGLAPNSKEFVDFFEGALESAYGGLIGAIGVGGMTGALAGGLELKFLNKKKVADDIASPDASMKPVVPEPTAQPLQAAGEVVTAAEGVAPKTFYGALGDGTGEVVPISTRQKTAEARASSTTKASLTDFIEHVRSVVPSEVYKQVLRFGESLGAYQSAWTAYTDALATKDEAAITKAKNVLESVKPNRTAQVSKWSDGENSFDTIVTAMNAFDPATGSIKETATTSQRDAIESIGYQPIYRGKMAKIDLVDGKTKVVNAADMTSVDETKQQMAIDEAKRQGFSAIAWQDNNGDWNGLVFDKSALETVDNSIENTTVKAEGDSRKIIDIVKKTVRRTSPKRDIVGRIVDAISNDGQISREDATLTTRAMKAMAEISGLSISEFANLKFTYGNLSKIMKGFGITNKKSEVIYDTNGRELFIDESNADPEDVLRGMSYHFAYIISQKKDTVIKRDMDKLYGKPIESWKQGDYDKFGTDFLLYMRNKAGVDDTNSIFHKVSQFIKKVFDRIKDMGQVLEPEVELFFDHLFSGQYKTIEVIKREYYDGTRLIQKFVDEFGPRFGEDKIREVAIGVISIYQAVGLDPDKIFTVQFGMGTHSNPYVHGYVQTFADGSMDLRIMDKANVETIIHEFLHVLSSFASNVPELKEVLDKAYGKKFDEWTHFSDRGVTNEEELLVHDIMSGIKDGWINATDEIKALAQHLISTSSRVFGYGGSRGYGQINQKSAIETFKDLFSGKYADAELRAKAAGTITDNFIPMTLYNEEFDIDYELLERFENDKTSVTDEELSLHSHLSGFAEEILRRQEVTEAITLMVAAELDDINAGYTKEQIDNAREAVDWIGGEDGVEQWRKWIKSDEYLQRVIDILEKGGSPLANDILEMVTGDGGSFERARRIIGKDIETYRNEYAATLVIMDKNNSMIQIKETNAKVQDEIRHQEKSIPPKLEIHNLKQTQGRLENEIAELNAKIASMRDQIKEQTGWNKRVGYVIQKIAEIDSQLAIAKEKQDKKLIDSLTNELGRLNESLAKAKAKIAELTVDSVAFKRLKDLISRRAIAKAKAEKLMEAISFMKLRGQGGLDSSIARAIDWMSTKVKSKVKDGTFDGPWLTLISNAIGGVDSDRVGVLLNTNPKRWTADDINFIVQVKSDLINEGKKLRQQVIDSNTEKAMKIRKDILKSLDNIKKKPQEIRDMVSALINQSMRNPQMVELIRKLRVSFETLMDLKQDYESSGKKLPKKTEQLVSELKSFLESENDKVAESVTAEADALFKPELDGLELQKLGMKVGVYNKKLHEIESRKKEFIRTETKSRSKYKQVSGTDADKIAIEKYVPAWHGIGDEKEKDTMLDKAVATALDFISPMALFTILDGGVENGAFMTTFYGAIRGIIGETSGYEDAILADIHTSQNLIKDFLKRNGLKANTFNEIVETSMVDIKENKDGSKKTLKFSVRQAMEIYSATFSKRKYEAVLYGRQLTKEGIDEIVANLPQPYKELTLAMMDHMQRFEDRFAETYELLTGKRYIGSDGKYSPIVRMIDKTEESVVSMMKNFVFDNRQHDKTTDASMVDMTNAIERVVISAEHQGKVKLDMVDNYLEHVETVSRAINAGLPGSIISEAMGFGTKDTSVANLMKNVIPGGENVYNFLYDVIAREQRPYFHEVALMSNRILSKFVRNSTVAGLMFMPLNMALQIAGILSASTFSKNGAWFSLKSIWNTPGYMVSMIQKSFGGEGRYMENVYDNAQFLRYRSPDYIMAELQMAKLSGLDSFSMKFTSTGMYGFNLMDRASVAASYSVLVDEYISENKKSYNEKNVEGKQTTYDLHRDATTFAKMVISKTQPNADNVSTAQIFRAGQGTLASLFTGYMQAVSKLGEQIWIEGPIKIASKHSGKLSNKTLMDVYGFMLATVGMSALGTAMYFFAKNDWPEDEEGQQKAILQMILDATVGMAGVVGSAVESAVNIATKTAELDTSPSFKGVPPFIRAMEDMSRALPKSAEMMSEGEYVKGVMKALEGAGMIKSPSNAIRHLGKALEDMEADDQLGAALHAIGRN